MPRTEKRARYRRIADRGERERDDREWVIGFSHFQNGNLFFPLAPVHRVAWLAKCVLLPRENIYICIHIRKIRKEGRREDASLGSCPKVRTFRWTRAKDRLRFACISPFRL